MKFATLFLLCFQAFAQQAMLPDPKLTPGAINFKVSQANIGKTICRAGWTKTVRPPASYTDKLKIQQMRDRGIAGAPKDYEEDHLVPLSLGGNPRDPRNLWPEPWPEAKLKDHGAEDALNKKVCAGELSLAEAQIAIARDWTKVYLENEGKPPVVAH